MLTKNIILLDDHQIILDSCCSLLAEQPYHIAWQGSDPDSAYQHYIEAQADLLILDLSLGKANGISVIKKVFQHQPKARIMVFSMHKDSLLITYLLSLGVLAYVTKSSAPAEYMDAVRCALARQPYLSNDITHHGKLASNQQSLVSPLLSELSQQERKVFVLASQGLSAEAISQQLKLSKVTITNYLRTIKNKLNLTSSLALIKAGFLLNANNS